MERGSTIILCDNVGHGGYYQSSGLHVSVVLGKIVIGCLPRVLEVSRVVDDTEVPRILWVQCATSAECKTIRIAVSTVKDSWVTALGLRPLVYKPSVCVDKMTWVKSRGLT